MSESVSMVRSSAEPEPREPGATLEVRDLCVTYRQEQARLPVVQNVNLALHANRTVALVGESGSGKTTVARALMGLVRPPTGMVSGNAYFGGRDLLAMSERELSDLRGAEMAMIFQEPMRSLNPAYTVGDQIAESVRRHTGASRKQAWARAREVFEQVQIPNAGQRLKRYPFELSGGMCQRVMIAMAIACKPAVLIADEPTTALDVTVQSQVLDLLKQLQDDLGLAMLFITHDLGVVADVADVVAVMYAGQIVESGTAVDVFERPKHPYASGLLTSIPSLADGDADELPYIAGQVPSALEWPSGCRFQARCSFARSECTEPIPLERVDDRLVRCIRTQELVLEGVRGG
jgi:peptide/nickel transport system ATP-binding protein